MNIDLKIGTVEIPELVTFRPEMTREHLLRQIKDCQGINISKEKTSIFQSKKLDIFLSTFKEKFEGYGIESITIRIEKEILRCICINLLPHENDNYIESILDIFIVKTFRKTLKSRELIFGNSKINFKMSWGVIEVLYDIKISCTAVCIVYH